MKAKTTPLHSLRMIYHTFVYLGRVEFDKHWFIHGEDVQVFVNPDTVAGMDRIHRLSGAALYITDKIIYTLGVGTLEMKTPPPP